MNTKKLHGDSKEVCAFHWRLCPFMSYCMFRCCILHFFFPIFLLADGGLKARLEMIKNHAIAVLQELKVRFISKLFLQKLERYTVKCFKT